MSSYMDYFPKIVYDIKRNKLTSYVVATNIFFRLRIIREVLSNISSYYEYIIKEADTPEILAEKIYGDPEAHWIIIYANDIADPMYDWPMNDRIFKKYLINKYKPVVIYDFQKQLFSDSTLITADSEEYTADIEFAPFDPELVTDWNIIAWLKTNIYQYEKIITRILTPGGITSEYRVAINKYSYAENTNNVVDGWVYDTYDTLPEKTVNTYNIADEQTITEIITKNELSYYDYEVNLNEAKRTIKIIKPEYYNQIQSEFKKLTGYGISPFTRKLV